MANRRRELGSASRMKLICDEEKGLENTLQALRFYCLHEIYHSCLRKEKTDKSLPVALLIL